MATAQGGPVIPSDLGVVAGIGEKGSESEFFDGGGVESGDEFAADPVAGVVAGLVQRDGHGGVAEGETEGKPGEAAADDNDRVGVLLHGAGGGSGGHGRRMATIR